MSGAQNIARDPLGKMEAGVPAGIHTQEVLLGLGYDGGEIDEFEKTGLFR
jgi:hypothetical protein